MSDYQLATDFQEYLYRVSSQVPFEHAQWAKERGDALLAELKRDYLISKALAARLEAVQRTVESQNLEIAASQARERQLREKLSSIAEWDQVTQDSAEKHGLGIALWRGCVAEANMALSIPTDDTALSEMIEAARREERDACEALYEHEHVQAPVGNSAWGEAYQEGWIVGCQAYRDAIRARGTK